MSTAKAKRAAAPTATVVTETAVKQVEQVVTAGKETIENVVKASQDAATKGYENAAQLTKDQVQAAVKVQNEAFKSYEDTVQTAKETLDALTKSSTILSQGLQDLTKAFIALSQQTVEETVSASKQLLAVKTLPELVDAQAAIAKTSLDKLFSEGTRLSDMSVKLFEQAFQPLSERVNATVDKLVKRAA